MPPIVTTFIMAGLDLELLINHSRAQPSRIYFHVYFMSLCAPPLVPSTRLGGSAPGLPGHPACPPADGQQKPSLGLVPSFSHWLMWGYHHVEMIWDDKGKQSALEEKGDLPPTTLGPMLGGTIKGWFELAQLEGSVNWSVWCGPAFPGYGALTITTAFSHLLDSYLTEGWLGGGGRER